MFATLKAKVQAAVVVGLVALCVAAYFYGAHQGKLAERAKWMDAELEQAEALRATILDLQRRNDELTAANAAIQAAAEADKAENRRLSNEVERLIDRTPAVRIKRIEVPGDCPAVECPVPDIRHDYRLHNCALDPADCELSDTASPDSGLIELPET